MRNRNTTEGETKNCHCDQPPQAAFIFIRSCRAAAENLVSPTEFCFACLLNLLACLCTHAARTRYALSAELPANLSRNSVNGRKPSGARRIASARFAWKTLIQRAPVMYGRLRVRGKLGIALRWRIVAAGSSTFRFSSRSEILCSRCELIGRILIERRHFLTFLSGLLRRDTSVSVARRALITPRPVTRERNRCVPPPFFRLQSMRLDGSRAVTSRM